MKVAFRFAAKRLPFDTVRRDSTFYIRNSIGDQWKCVADEINQIIADNFDAVHCAFCIYHLWKLLAEFINFPLEHKPGCRD